MTFSLEDEPVDGERVKDPKMEQAVFGEEVRIFMTEDRIGKYLVARAADEVQEGLLELKEADPDDAKGIRKIQFKIRVAESVVGWLAAAVDDGNRARQILEDEG
jgi:hypothetical protein